MRDDQALVLVLGVVIGLAIAVGALRFGLDQAVAGDELDRGEV